MSAFPDLAARLERTLAAELPLLRAIPDGPETSRPDRPCGRGWSRREEMGHLVDSAVNNHHRFARAALDAACEGPGYDQEGWVRVHGYAAMPWPAVVDAWAAHNAILVPLLRGIPDAKADTPCAVGGAAPVALRFLVEDYLVHMQHHLDQVLRRSPVTPYPRA